VSLLFLLLLLVEALAVRLVMLLVIQENVLVLVVV
jgi:hypothetical protein